MNAPTQLPPAGDARQLRRLNLERLLSLAMDKAGPFTRGELVHETALSAPTVGSLTASLLRQRLLNDLGTGPSRGGRRPGLLEFNSRFGIVAGIVLEARRTQLAIADLRGEMLARRSLATPADLEPEPLLSWVAARVRDLTKRLRRPWLVTVAAGAPGAVDARDGSVVALAPSLKGWSQVPMAQILSRKLAAPVSLDNDVNLAILGERWRGAARGHDTCAFISVGTGIGAGILVGGSLHRGHHFLAGEIALMCMGPQYVDRDFGQQGCLETLAESLLDAARDGDRAATRALNEAATLLGIAATNLSIVLDPSLVVFGGPLMPGGELLLNEVRRIVRRIIPSPPEIVVSALGDSAPLWGSLLVATESARRRLLSELAHVEPGTGPGTNGPPPRPAARGRVRARRARAG